MRSVCGGCGSWLGGPTASPTRITLPSANWVLFVVCSVASDRLAWLRNGAGTSVFSSLQRSLALIVCSVRPDAVVAIFLS
jgi:hypothetical protein